MCRGRFLSVVGNYSLQTYLVCVRIAFSGRFTGRIYWEGVLDVRMDGAVHQVLTKGLILFILWRFSSCRGTSWAKIVCVEKLSRLHVRQTGIIFVAAHKVKRVKCGRFPSSMPVKKHLMCAERRIRGKHMGSRAC